MSRCTLDTLLPPRRASQFLRLRRFTATLSHGFDLSPVRCAAALSCRRVMERLTRLRAFAACLFARLAPSVRSLRVRGRTGSRRCCRLYARATEHLALWNACQGAVSRLQTPAFSLNWSLEAFRIKKGAHNAPQAPRSSQHPFKPSGAACHWPSRKSPSEIHTSTCVRNHNKCFPPPRAKGCRISRR